MQYYITLFALALAGVSVALPAEMNGEAVAEDASAFSWEMATSENGNPFAIGTRITDDGEARERSEMVKNPFKIPVTWKPQGLKWITTSDKVKNTAAITRYMLGTGEQVFPVDSHIFTRSAYDNVYCLLFSNTEHYDYHFIDKTGDNYQVNTYLNRDHYVCYTSTDPTIVSVVGV